MKAHISKKMIQPGGKFLCNTSNFRTSGLSATVEAFKTEWVHMQCEKCATILRNMEAKQAAKAERV
jgi:hypothetical protein